MYFYGPPTYDQAKAGRPARTYICDERGSGISVLAAGHDDDDNN